MACGERIPAGYQRRRRKFPFIAISRDLLQSYPFGDTLLIRGDVADPYWDTRLNGAYIVKDLMNKRHHHRVDILSRPSHERDIGVWRARITHYYANPRNLLQRTTRAFRVAR